LRPSRAAMSPLFPYPTLFRSRPFGSHLPLARGRLPAGREETGIRFANAWRRGFVRTKPRRLVAAALITGRITSRQPPPSAAPARSEGHTSELQSRENLVCRLL